MAAPNSTDIAEIAKASVPDATFAGTLTEAAAGRGSINVEKAGHLTTTTSGSEHDDAPTEEEMQTLRRVSGPIVWSAYTIAFCELAERFS